MTSPKNALFNKTFDAFLFDMDGTLLNSIESTERVWGQWLIRHGLDPVTVLPTIHGMRATDTVRRFNLEGVDPEREALVLAEAELADVEGIVPIEGAIHFLKNLPSDRWAIVTSAPRRLAERRLKAAGIPLPDTIVTAEDVSAGKPNPTCFELGAQRLGFDARNCLVFEDAPAGILAGERAGSQVVVVTATHPHTPATTHPTIDSYDTLSVEIAANGQLGISRCTIEAVG